MDGFDALNEEISRLRRVPELGKTAAPEIAKALDAALRENIAAGLSPQGNPWQPTRKGEQPKLGRKLFVRAKGSIIEIVLGGKSYLHHTGIARGRITRRVIPTVDLPEKFATIVRDKMKEAFESLMSGGRSSG